MNIAILGYTDQGRSAYEYWNQPENTITIHDSRTDLQVPSAQPVLGKHYLESLGRYDLIVRGAPSIHPREILAANPDNPNILDKVTTVTDEFLRVCPTRNVIGVTGTKGKGTTSTLIARMLETAGFRTHLGGNIGIPPLEMLRSNIMSEDWVVLELANFQLIDITHSPHIGVCLMVVPEHLNWHKDMAEYMEAKSQLFRWQTANDIAIFNPLNDASSAIAAHSPGKHITYMAPPGAYVQGDMIKIEGADICDVHSLKLLGEHNWQNACAAVTAVWQITQDVGAIQTVLTSFSGLEHRIEFVREFDGVSYYNDSFGTTPETAQVAVQAFTESKVLILGGSSKNSDYSQLAQTIANGNVRQVILIGNSDFSEPIAAPAILSALHANGFENITSLVRSGGCSMTDIIATARAQSQPGDIVLLSTACASFDMFKDYKDRGNQFKAAVQALA